MDTAWFVRRLLHFGYKTKFRGQRMSSKFVELSLWALSLYFWHWQQFWIMNVNWTEVYFLPAVVVFLKASAKDIYIGWGIGVIQYVVCVNCVPQWEFSCFCTAVLFVRLCVCITSLSCPNNNHVSSKTSHSHCREIGLVYTHWLCLARVNTHAHTQKSPRPVSLSSEFTAGCDY